MTKKELREQIKAKIARMKAADKETASLYLSLQIIGTAEWQQADTVLLYMALPDEADVALLLQDAEGSDKRVLLPVVHGDSLDIKVYHPAKMKKQGPFQIMEPTEDCETVTDLSDIDLAIIPGRAFTKEGDRMGRGKGYYDRLLPALNCPKWGVAFSCQLVKELPSETWDVKMDKVFAM